MSAPALSQFPEFRTIFLAIGGVIPRFENPRRGSDRSSQIHPEKLEKIIDFFGHPANNPT
jgi:hypothetical protein